MHPFVRPRFKAGANSGRPPLPAPAWRASACAAASVAKRSTGRWGSFAGSPQSRALLARQWSLVRTQGLQAARTKLWFAGLAGFKLGQGSLTDLAAQSVVLKPPLLFGLFEAIAALKAKKS